MNKINGWYSSKNGGFTLVEVLVVLSITALVTVMVMQILTSLFRSTTKTASISEVKQNGQLILLTMEQTIRNAVPTPQCLTGGTPGVRVVKRGSDSSPEMRTTTFACITDPGGSGKLVIATGLGVPQPSYQSLVNQAIQVVPNSCTFTCPSVPANAPARVNVQFSLSAYVNGPTPRTQEATSENFTSSISQRSY